MCNTLAEPGSDLPARGAHPGEQSDATAEAGSDAPQTCAGPSPSAVIAAGAADGATDLGPLADPTPAERALSLLRSAVAAVGIAWPVREDVFLALVAVEEDLLRAAREMRTKRPPEAEVTAECGRIDSAAHACWHVGCALRAERDKRRQVDARHFAMRATEELGLVKGAKS